jgi:peptidoglycan-N-acetylglucosamine deacetylase
MGRRLTIAKGLAAAICAALSASCAGPKASSPEPSHRAETQTNGLRVAITIDDLGATEESSELALTERLLAAMRTAGAPVAVFANCKALDLTTLLAWQRAGATIGNHTQTHLSVDAVDASGAWNSEAWWSDVRSCHETLGQTLRRPVTYFRFPYLRYGNEPERRRIAAEKLRTLDYTVAHVTAATSDWLLAQYYDTAKRERDEALAAEIADAYVAHMRESLQAASSMAHAKVGRDVDQITLLHVNRLAGDHLPRVLSSMKADGYAFVSLEDALADDVYALEDGYVGNCGCSWLARIAPTVQRGDGYVFGDYEDQIRERFAARIALLQSRDAGAATP